MSDVVEPLLLDLLESLARRPRPYAEVMDAWRTSCPRLPVWETALDRGFVLRGELVEASSLGLRFLDQHGRAIFRSQRPGC